MFKKANFYCENGLKYMLQNCSIHVFCLFLAKFWKMLLESEFYTVNCLLAKMHEKCIDLHIVKKKSPSLGDFMPAIANKCTPSVT
jgi:hypothetical protein